MRETPEPRPRGATDDEAVELCREWMRYLGASDAVAATGESRQICDLYSPGFLGWVENKRGNPGLEAVERAGRTVAADGRRGLIFIRHGALPHAVDRADYLGMAIFGFDPECGTLDGVNLVGRDWCARGLAS